MKQFILNKIRKVILHVKTKIKTHYWPKFVTDFKDTIQIVFTFILCVIGLLGFAIVFMILNGLSTVL